MVFPWLKRDIEKRSIAHPQPLLLELFGATTTAAGVAVNPTSALKCSPAFACVRLISELMGELPAHVYRRNRDGSRERVRDHAAAILLNEFANPWTPGSEFRRETTLAALQYGRGLAKAIRVRGELRELHALPSTAVAVETDDLTGEPSYEVSLADGGTQALGWTDVLDVKAIGGEAPINLAREAIGLALTLEEHGAQYFKNGARPSGILTFKGSLSETIASTLSAAWQKAVGGDNRGKIVPVGGDASYHSIAFNSTDSQFLENRRFQLTEVARFFGISPVLLGVLEGATFANSETMGQQFLQFTLLPWIRAWQGAISRTLFTEEERRDHYIEFSVNDLVKADIAARFEAYSKAIGGPFMVPNEARARENMPATDGGDVLRVPLNTAPASGGSDDE